MITKNYCSKTFLVECDNGCGTSYLHGSDDWNAMIAAIKSEGWMIERIGDKQWEHWCPECAGGDAPGEP